MKKKYSIGFTGVLVFVSLLFYSCNTYKWQRKRYYQSSKLKNWNNYNPEKNKEEEDKQLEKYFKQ